MLRETVVSQSDECKNGPTRRDTRGTRLSSFDGIEFFRLSVMGCSRLSTQKVEL